MCLNRCWAHQCTQLPEWLLHLRPLHHLWPTCRWCSPTHWWIQPEFHTHIQDCHTEISHFSCQWCIAMYGQPYRVRSNPMYWMGMAAEGCRQPRHQCLRSSLPPPADAPEESRTSSSAGQTEQFTLWIILAFEGKCYTNVSVNGRSYFVSLVTVFISYDSLPSERATLLKIGLTGKETATVRSVVNKPPG